MEREGGKVQAGQARGLSRAKGREWRGAVSGAACLQSPGCWWGCRCSLQINPSRADPVHGLITPDWGAIQGS